MPCTRPPRARRVQKVSYKDAPLRRALDGAAKAAGVAVLNEMGLDPGMDHMSAMKVIHEIQQEGELFSFFFYFRPFLQKGCRRLTIVFPPFQH